jgi:hypothetical protein
MAVVYPISTPTNVGIASIELRAKNAVALAQSPFTYNQQVHQYSGQQWEADVTLPPMNRDDAEAWIAFLMRLQGRVGTFLLGDPAAKSVRGTATSGTFTCDGDFDDTCYANITSGKTLKAGDYFQLGSGSDATLHKVLADFTGTGSNAEIEVWPQPRKARSSVTMDFTEAKGVFRLNTNEVSWSVNDASFYGITFGCMEVI